MSSLPEVIYFYKHLKRWDVNVFVLMMILSLPQKLRAIRKTGHHHLSSLFEKFVYIVEYFCCSACSVNSVMIPSDHFNSVSLVPSEAKSCYYFSTISFFSSGFLCTLKFY